MNAIQTTQITTQTRLQQLISELLSIYGEDEALRIICSLLQKN